MHIALAVIVLVAIVGTALVGFMYITESQQELADIRIEVQQRADEVSTVDIEGKFTALNNAGRGQPEANVINGTINIVNSGDTPVEIVQIRVYDEHTGELVDVIPIYHNIDNYANVELKIEDIPQLQQWLLCEQTGEGRHPLWKVDYESDPVYDGYIATTSTITGFNQDYYENILYSPDKLEYMPGGSKYNNAKFDASKKWAYSQFKGPTGSDGNVCIDVRPDHWKR